MPNGFVGSVVNASSRKCSRLLRSAGIAVSYLALLTGCEQKPKVEGAKQHPVLTGAGATFPYPVYARWFSEYLQATGTRINYYSVGSIEGIGLLRADSVDFGATDIPLPDSLLMLGSQVRFAQVPMVVGGVAIAYNLPGAPPLRLDGPALAGILLGKIRRWDDPRLASLNPESHLPAIPIAFIHRDDISGTTTVLDAYLRAASEDWRKAQRAGVPVHWTVGEGEHGNEGISGRLKATSGAIGYVPLAYARLFRLSSASLRNANGEFVAPSEKSVEAAANAVLGANPPPQDLRVPLTNAIGKDVYPIAAITWLVFPVSPKNEVKGADLRAFVRWALARGADDAAELGYAPLSQPIIKRLDSAVAQLAKP